MKKLLPWIILFAWIAVTIWQWPKPSPKIPDDLRALYAAKDSIQKLKDKIQDSLTIAQGEKIILKEMVAIQIRDLEELKKKNEKLYQATDRKSVV